MQHDGKLLSGHVLVKPVEWLDILTARQSGFPEELVLYIMELCGFHGTGKLICTCHCVQIFFRKLEFTSNIQIDASWESAVNVEHFREFVKTEMNENRKQL